MWCIPPQQDAEFVAAMEDVLDVYERPDDEKRPVACSDESSKQPIGETVQPIPTASGQPERVDHEYVRNKVINLFMPTMPLIGWRSVKVTDRRTMHDFAAVIRWLVEEVCEEAEKVVLMLDNLDTHRIARLYGAFPAEQARRIAEKLEIHYAPKHGSWLNIAEIESSALTRQCLDRRIETKADLERHVAAWEEARNEGGHHVRWRFTTADARIKLRRLYPSH